MKTFLLSFLSALLLFGISACKKDGSGSNTGGTNPPTTPGQSTVLAAVYAIDTTIAAPHDTIGRYNVTFDALNRTSVVTELDTRPNGDSDYYMIQSFTYNGSDTNAIKRTEYSKTFSVSGTTSTIDRDTSYYTFTNGKCVYDSSTSPGQYYADKFAYAGNTVLRTGASLGGGVKSTHQSTIYQTFVNGNLTYQIDTLVSHGSTVINPALFSYQRMEITTSYISNPNPFSQVVKNFLRPYSYDDIGIGSAMAPKMLIAQQHAALSIWGNGVSGNNIYDLSYTYSFRADGYPVIARQAFTQNSLVEKRKLYFVYK